MKELDLVLRVMGRQGRILYQGKQMYLFIFHSELESGSRYFISSHLTCQDWAQGWKNSTGSVVFVGGTVFQPSLLNLC